MRHITRANDVRRRPPLHVWHLLLPPRCHPRSRPRPTASAMRPSTSSSARPAPSRPALSPCSSLSPRRSRHVVLHQRERVEPDQPILGQLLAAVHLWADECGSGARRLLGPQPQQRIGSRHPPGPALHHQPDADHQLLRPSARLLSRSPRPSSRVTAETMPRYQTYCNTEVKCAMDLITAEILPTRRPGVPSVLITSASRPAASPHVTRQSPTATTSARDRTPSHRTSRHGSTTLSPTIRWITSSPSSWATPVRPSPSLRPHRRGRHAGADARLGGRRPLACAHLQGLSELH